MNHRQIKWLIGIASICIALIVILMLALSGFDLSGFWVHGAVHFGQ